MRIFKKLFNLQLFADGGDGGASAAAPAGDGAGVAASTGAENASAADSQRLRDLGVPEKYVQRQEARNKKRGIAAAASAQQQPAEQPPAAEPPTEEQTEPPAAEQPAAPKRMTWDEIKADPEYQAAYQSEMQKAVTGRLKSSKAAEESLNKVKPALEVLAGYYKMDASDLSKLDIDALVKSVIEDRTYYEDRSVAEGRSVDEIMREAAQARRNNALQEETMRRHFVSLREQEATLKKTIPGFDLNVEMQNPAFARMTAPGSMLSLEQAYNAIHHKEIVAAAKERATQEAREALSKSVQAGRTRPQEAGQSAAPAPVPTLDFKDPAVRAQLKQQIRAAAAQGKHLPLQGGRR